MNKTNAIKRSCSTFIAMQDATKKSEIIFAKNSDRPVNESQPLEYFPAKDHAVGDYVQCTYIEIPEATHTYAYIGSRPYNIYGFEHGINEHGVIIGNEAVTGRETPELKWGLIGMDMLRLALARSKSAKEAVQVIGSLLEKYGTGGDPLIRAQYFNANYIISDYEEGYIFESCQRYWVAKKIEKAAHIGNIYDITDDYDMSYEGLEDEMIKKGWAAKSNNGKINISQAFSISDCDYEDAEAYFRFARQDDLIMNKNNHDVNTMMSILRDHYDKELRSKIPFDVATSKIPTICCHPGGMNGCASAASVVCTLNKDAEEPFKIIYWSSMAPPCCSIFIPHFNIGYIPEVLANASAKFDEESPWWIFTKLERYIALNYDVYSPKVKEEFSKLEKENLSIVEEAKRKYDGNCDSLKKITDEALDKAISKARELTQEIEGKVQNDNINHLLIDYFIDSAEMCGMKHNITRR